MSAIPIAIPAIETSWRLPSRGRVGMFSLIGAESAIFTIFLVAYIFYIGKSLGGPTPQQVLHIPIFNTICLLSSSFTIHLFFGTTYYSLVGLHAFHVTAGLVGLSVVMVLALAGRVKQEHAEHVDVLSLYWHFVDVVWVVVFTTVYIIGR